MSFPNGGELLVLLLLVLVVVGPERLPRYTQQLADLVRGGVRYAKGARDSLKEEMGPEFEDIDWKKLDPRQYDPRRIVRDALTEAWDEPVKPRSPGGPQAAQPAQPSYPSAPAAGAAAASASVPAARTSVEDPPSPGAGAPSPGRGAPSWVAGRSTASRHVPGAPTPYDTEAT
ncbi:hypothetical protein [Pseudokineococcus sp. 1T1Z-3]|uniref:hypothetical protein n=1 Tax=Pseudokineococcus sp. 1T1Z-3 TaxID=3132745 RepID=UPI0030A9038A